MSLIHIQDLTKHFKILNRKPGLRGAVRDLFSGDYRNVKAVDGISFDIEPGEIVGYIGPNGAGKSTTIKMMTGILKPTGGTITGQRAGSLCQPHPPGADHGRGVRPAHPAVVGPARDRILQDPERDLQGRSEDLRPPHGSVQRTGRAEDALLAAGADALARQRMLCDITASFLHNPQVVFLDEPTIGLDISVKAKIRSVIKELNRDTQHHHHPDHSRPGRRGSAVPAHHHHRQGQDPV